MKQCENCNTKHDGLYGSGRFCGPSCSRSYSSNLKRAEINQKVSAKLTGRKLSDNHKLAIIAGGLKANGGKQTAVVDCEFCGSETKRKRFCSVDCMKNHTISTKTAFENYRTACKFIFNVYDHPDKFDLNLITKHGWYTASNRGGNLDGVSRDHMISVRYGFENAIPANLIAHPANCELVLQRDNSRKRTKCTISVEELRVRISEWSNAGVA